MEHEKYFDKIEAFLRGALPPAEADSFRQEVAENPELKAALLRHRLADQAIEIAHDDYLRHKLQAVKEKYGPLPTPEATVFSLRRVMTQAAAVLLLVIGGIGVYAQLNYSDRALVRQFYSQASSPTIAGEDAEADALFTQGLYLYYQEKDYQRALQAFSAIPPSSEKHSQARYFIAHCQLQTSDFANAAQSFDTLLQQGPVPVFAERGEIEWNRILALIGAGRETEVRPELQKIIQSAGYSSRIKERAQNLDKELNSFWRKISF